jgi:hypothetical protein
MKSSTIALLALCSISLSAAETDDALSYLNQLRTGTGLIPYTLNAKLNSAAQNHANYLLEENIFSHQETNENNSHYTGEWGHNRLTNVSYTWTIYGENINVGSDTVEDSIDGLFQSIYHRLGFLSFDTEDLGVGYIYDVNYNSHSAHVYDMGTQYPRYRNNVRDENPKIIKWPYSNYTKAQPAFFNNEYPVPLPECTQGGSSGNPISIQFNPAKSGEIAIDTFTLQNRYGTQIQTKLLTHNLSDKQFVIFPLDRLNWDTNYTAIFTYSEDGVQKSETWSFKTRKLEHPVYILDDTQTTYDVAKNSTYAFFIKPENCNETSSSYGHQGGFSFKKVLDKDTYYANIIANTGADTTAIMGGKTFNFHIFTQEITNLEFINVANNSVTVKWTHEKSGEESGYKIYRDGKFLTQVSSDTDTYTDSTVVPNTTYTYTVKVTNG